MPRHFDHCKSNSHHSQVREQQMFEYCFDCLVVEGR